MTQIHRIKCGSVNCYLLSHGGSHLLVDAGNTGEHEKLIRRLARLGVAPGALGMVLLTHNHSDHIGAAPYFQARRIPVGMHPADAPQPGSVTGAGAAGALLLALSRRALKTQQPFQPDVPLADGMSLTDYGIPATVIALPGHTAGSVGVLLEDGRLLCGDALMNFVRPHAPYIAEDFPAARASIEALRGRVTDIYPGHGGDFRLLPKQK